MAVCLEEVLAILAQHNITCTSVVFPSGIPNLNQGNQDKTQKYKREFNESILQRAAVCAAMSVDNKANVSLWPMNGEPSGCLNIATPELLELRHGTTTVARMCKPDELIIIGRLGTPDKIIKVKPIFVYNHEAQQDNASVS
jgi:hypothetical protein